MLKNFITRWFKQPEPPKPLIDTPTESDLKKWASSEWIEYQAWLFHHGFLTLHQWQQLRHNALSWHYRPLFSIITPVFNTHPTHLRECIYSVQTQAYPNWEMCLVDDGSDNPDTKACLQDLIADDPRLQLHTFEHNQGICHATNQAIAMAYGEYLVFLDHDDRIALDALYYAAETIRNYPNTDIIYSDRDSLSPNGLRFMHLFKPNWSPETLLSGNYLFHLMIYRRELVEQLGGVRVGLEGSQDYDLILRASEKEPVVRHIPKILYHWRMHEQSVSMAHNVKEYAYMAGIRALTEALERRGLSGKVSENKALWRGHYRLHLESSSPTNYQTLRLNTFDDYANQINQAFERETGIDYLVILGPGVVPVDSDAIPELTAWLQIAEIGIVTGKVIDEQAQILHAGLVQRANGIPLSLYAGFPEQTTPGYMAVTAIVRNVSTPQPACCVIRRDLWQRLEGLKTDYEGPHALCDFALRALMLGKRIVYTPFARFKANDWQTPESWNENDRAIFVEHWSTWLNQGDPYYNPYLTLDIADMGLDLSPPK
jgi:O-antigen biosynthesis protein